MRDAASRPTRRDGKGRHFGHWHPDSNDQWWNAFDAGSRVACFQPFGMKTATDRPATMNLVSVRGSVPMCTTVAPVT